MILFWVHADGSSAINTYLKNRGQPLADCMRVNLYENFAPAFELTTGGHIFAALDRLTETQREAVASVYDQVSALHPAARLLNAPRRVLLRYALLKKLFESGLNSFNVFRATQAKQVRRFPVFVRGESDHGGARTPLLRNRQELTKGLIWLRARGYRLRDLIIVEFCDTSDGHGVFRKYAAFKVGDRIIPAHLLVGRHWMLKAAGNELDVDRAREGLDYVETNPHEARLRQVFSIANIDYGRIDYGVTGGTPQVWEINLNPTIGRRGGSERAPMSPEIDRLRERRAETFHSQLRSAFRRLEPEPSSSKISVVLEPQLLSRIKAETTRARQRTAVLASLHRFYDHAWAGRPLRLLYSRLAPPRARNSPR